VGKEPTRLQEVKRNSSWRRGLAASPTELEGAREELGLSLDQLWIEYCSLGGMASPFELDAYLHGAMTIGPREYNVLVLALNETFMLRGGNHRLPYWD
jgi:hypothetical protein